MIAIDTTFFAHSEAQSGKIFYSTSFFTADILDALVELGESENYCLIVNYNHEQFFRERFPKYKLIVLRWLPLSILNKLTKGKFPMTKLLKRFGVYAKAVNKDKNIKAVWFPFASLRTFVKTQKKALITIHDLYRCHTGDETEPFRSIVLDEKNLLSTISEYTKNDIEKTFSCHKRIAVIPNSIQCNVSETEEVKGCGHDFILDINAYNEKKNALTLLKAFNLIKEKTDLTLVFCAGYKDEEYFGKLKDFTQQNSLNDRVLFLFQIPERQRNWLLKNAKLFVTPSLFEGFGRTPVEAAICGIPVISTMETSLHEVTLGLVNYYKNATDEKELAELILKLIENPPSAETLTSIAEKLKTEYSSVNCAKKYLEIFKHIDS